MSEGKSDLAVIRTKSVPDLLSSWLGIVTLGLGVLGSIAAGIWYLSPLRDLDVTVVLEEEVQFSLPPGAEGIRQLAMTYDGKPVKRLGLVKVSVINSGKIPVQLPSTDGKPRPWTLVLRSTDEVPIQQVGSLESSPRKVQVLSEPGKTSSELALRMALLNPGHEVKLQVAVIGGTSQLQTIQADEGDAQIPNLRLAVTRHGVRSRVANALLPPLWGLTVLVLGSLFVRETVRSKEGLGKTPRAIVLNGLALLFMVLVASTLLAAGIAWVLSWAVYAASLR